MYEALFAVGIVCAVLAGLFLVASVAMFFGFGIPSLRRDVDNGLGQKQVEEIRKKGAEAAKVRHGAVNVFEELEKKAKVKKANTHSLNVGTTPTTLDPAPAPEAGTSVLSAQNTNPDFIIEKDIVFVSTNEVM